MKVRFRLHQWNKKLVKEIFSYSIWVFIAAMVFRLQWHTGQIVLGISADTVTVAIFGVGVLLGGYYGAFASAINTLLLPKATKMSVNNNTAEAYNSAMQRVGRINGFILFLVLSGFYVFGKEFIVLWVGETYLPSWEITFVMMIGMTLPLMQSFGNSILEAKKKNRFKSLVSLVTVSLAIAAALTLAPKYPLLGVIYPLFVALIINSLISSWYYYKIFGFNFWMFIKRTILQPLFYVMVPLVLLFILLKSSWTVQGWMDLALQVGLFVFLYALLIYFLVMNLEERKILKR